MSTILLIIALVSGVLNIPIALIEISIIRRFILFNQGLDKVPPLTKDEKKINILIRNFRKEIFSKEKQNANFSYLRKKIRILNYLSAIFTSIMFILLLVLYWLSRNLN